MEPKDNVNNHPINHGEENPNPPQPPNIKTQIDEGLDTLKTLVNQLRGMKEPNRESLATSFDIILKSIASSQGNFTCISKYRARMFECYNKRLDRNQVGDLGI